MMGALRDHAEGIELRRLSPMDEMEFVAGGTEGASRDVALLETLQANPELARELGAIATVAGADLQNAYPGETREHAIPNADWEQAGYDQIVEMNKLMGLEGL